MSGLLSLMGTPLLPTCARLLQSAYVSLIWKRLITKTHYEVLGLKPNADITEIKEAFVKKSKELHPDVNQRDPDNHRKFIKVAEAYSILSKGGSRRDYDRSLAAKLHQQKLQRSVYSSHSTGFTREPGSSFSQPDDEKVFWDETLWPMRDKSTDSKYEDTTYYGIKGISRLPNSVIICICMVLVLIGAVLHYFVLQKSRKYQKNKLDELNSQHQQLYRKSKDTVRAHGNFFQLTILKKKLESRKDSKNGR